MAPRLPSFSASLVTSPNTLANGRPISLPAGWGGGNSPSGNRLPGRSVGGLGEGPWDRKSDSCLSAYDPKRSSV